VANGVAFEGRDCLLDFLTTCLPEDYSGKHMNAPSLIEVAADRLSATAKTDVVWISQDFENRIVGRYDDLFERRSGRWLFSRRVESKVPFTPGPPMSETALSVSSATMPGRWAVGVRLVVRRADPRAAPPRPDSHLNGRS
jgi:hypothetical protein